jgi:hypothetical protein
MKRKVSAEAIDVLVSVVENIMITRGLKEKWLRHVCDVPVPLETDFDWPLRCAAWLLEEGL